jgi:hypothetical protein
MRNIRRIAAAAASTGLLAFGGLAAGPGSAHAATAPTQVTSCNYGSGATVTASVFPTCTATGSVNNPADLEVNLDPNGLLAPIWGTIILPLLGGITVNYSGSCSVDGSSKTFSGSYKATSGSAPTTTILSLQTLVGSPVPNSCTITLTVSTIAAIPSILGIITPFTIQASAQSITAVPGAVWQAAGTTSSGASAATCADVKGNGNSGTPVQAYTCLSALSSFFSTTATGQFVHNGDCLTDSGNAASLQPCTPGNTSQYWTGGTTKSELVNKGAATGQGCLTVPSYANGTQLTLAACTGAANQLWTAPAGTAGSGS